jgi:Holliday junction resolvase-like predicted endonuclease
VVSRADEVRKDGYECRQKAERAINPLDKERWLKIAEHWLQMAQEADDPSRNWRPT